MDHHKTSGRGRQAEDVVHEMHKRVLSASQIGLSRNPGSAIGSGNTAVAIPFSSLRRLQRLRRRRQVKGLSARQLWERKNSSRRATKRVNQGVGGSHRGRNGDQSHQAHSPNLQEQILRENR